MRREAHLNVNRIDSYDFPCAFCFSNQWEKIRTVDREWQGSEKFPQSLQTQALVGSGAFSFSTSLPIARNRSGTYVKHRTPRRAFKISHLEYQRKRGCFRLLGALVEWRYQRSRMWMCRSKQTPICRSIPGGFVGARYSATHYRWKCTDSYWIVGAVPFLSILHQHSKYKESGDGVLGMEEVACSTTTSILIWH